MSIEFHLPKNRSAYLHRCQKREVRKASVRSRSVSLPEAWVATISKVGQGCDDYQRGGAMIIRRVRRITAPRRLAVRNREATAANEGGGGCIGVVAKSAPGNNKDNHPPRPLSVSASASASASAPALLYPTIVIM